MSTDHRTATAEIMGTVISIAAPASTDAAVFAAATEIAFDHLRRADRIFSTFRPDSPVSRIRDGRLTLEQLREHPNGEEIRTVLALCAQLGRESGGAFDAWTVGGREGAARAASAASAEGAEPGFDPSGLVKGWAAEQAAAALTENGVPSHSLGAGGDIQVRAGAGEGRPWRIGISDPHRAGQLLTVIELVDGAVATSGTAERGAHIWDPRAGVPATALASVTIVGPNLTWADGYATAAHALAGASPGGVAAAYAWLQELAARTGYEALTVTQGTDVWWTEGFPAHAPALRRALDRSGELDLDATGKV
jgi:thiamine biosynthesis lipoprotein